MNIAVIQDLQKWSLSQNQVFELSDLKVLLNENQEATLFRKIHKLTDAKMLIRVKNGLYASPGATLENIASRIVPLSYISCATVLAKNALIGSVPVRKIQSIKTGRSRKFETPIGVIEYMSVCPRLFTGYETINGIHYALPEKAFLDVCYLYYKGIRFSFNPESDIDTEQLSKKKINAYLELYDQRFISYFNKMWGSNV